MLKNRVFRICIAAILLAVMLLSTCSCAFLLPSKMILKNAYKDVIEEIAEGVDDYYKKLDAYDVRNMSVDADISVELSSALINMLNSSTDVGIDLSLLNDADIHISENSKDNRASVQATLGYKGDELISADAIADLVNGDLYFAVPLLTSKSLMLDLQDVLDVDTAVITAGADIAKVLPDSKVIKNLMYRYFDIIMDNVNNVEKGITTLTANGISQKCVVLELTLTQLEVANIMLDVASALKQDKDVKNIIYSAVEYINEMQRAIDGEYAYILDPEEQYAEFVESCEDVIEDVQMAIDDGDVKDVTMVTVYNYMNFSHDIIGIDARCVEEYDSVRIFAGKADDGEQIGVEVSVETYYDDEFGSTENFKLLGTTQENKDIVSGSYEIIVDQESMLFIDFENIDTDLLEDGYINGSITLSPSSGLIDIIQNEVDIDSSIAGVAASAMSLKLDIEQKNNKSIKVVASVISGRSSYLTVTVDATISKGKDIVIPTDVTQDMNVWEDDFDFNALLERVQNSQLPDSIVQLIQLYILMLQWS